MTRETIYRIQEPVSEAVDSAPATPFDEIVDTICDGITNFAYDVSDVINDLALTISSAGA
jgi:hypothetical protein